MNLNFLNCTNVTVKITPNHTDTREIKIRLEGPCLKGKKFFVGKVVPPGTSHWHFSGPKSGTIIPKERWDLKIIRVWIWLDAGGKKPRVLKNLLTQFYSSKSNVLQLLTEVEVNKGIIIIRAKLSQHSAYNTALPPLRQTLLNQSHGQDDVTSGTLNQGWKNAGGKANRQVRMTWRQSPSFRTGKAQGEGPIKSWG